MSNLPAMKNQGNPNEKKQHIPFAGKDPYYKSLVPFFPWWQEPRPPDWNAVFGREAPLEIEIGFGNGEALARRAAERPDLNLIGVEVAWASTKRALRRLFKAGVTNVRLVQADARCAFRRLFNPESIHGAYSLFPIPWPKERHEKRRLFSREFLRLVGNRLEMGAALRIATDFQPLTAWISEQAVDSGLSGRWERTPARFDTKYERKWQDTGQEHFYEIHLVKTRHVHVPVEEDLSLQTIRLDDFDPGGFAPENFEGPITVHFKDFVYDPVRLKGLLEAMIIEDGLMQDVFIQIEKRDDYWHVGLAQSSRVVPTEGLRLALLQVGRAARGKISGQ